MREAPSRPGRRWRFAVVAVACVGAVVWLLADALSGNLVYFRTVSEAVAERDTAGTGRFRLAGAVVAGSVVSTPEGVSFEVSDGKARASVLHHGDPPELFKDGVPVVCEGGWEGSRFVSDRIMIKHGSDYVPPSVSSDPGPSDGGPSDTGGPGASS